MLFLSLPNKHRSLGLNKPSCNVEESESFSSYSSSSFHRSPSPSPLHRFLRQLGSLIMPCSPTSLYSRIRSWLRDYDRIQSLAVVLIYIQIGCAMIGSLGALFNGVLLINLVVALFALVAIESSSQSLGRAYAVLLICSILLDITWFILFSHTIWYVTRDSISEAGYSIHGAIRISQRIDDSSGRSSWPIWGSGKRTRCIMRCCILNLNLGPPSWGEGLALSYFLSLVD